MKTRLAVAGVQQISESAFDDVTGILKLKVIDPGFNKSKSRYYPAEVLKRDYKIFEGAKMFADHQTSIQAKERPEGSVNNWVANIKKVWPESNGVIRAEAAVIDPPFKAKLTELHKQNMLGEMGVSIRAIGEGTTREHLGTKTNVVEALLASRSVDFVTYAGAGGQVEAMESEGDPNDVDLINEAQLRERRPDLIQIIETANRREGNTMEFTEQQLATEKAARIEAERKLALSEAATATEKTAREAAEKKLEEADKAVKKASASTELTKMLSESKLPEPAQKRLQKQFSEAVSTDGMKEAIEAEKEYIKSVAPNSGGVRNNGKKDNVQESDGEEYKVDPEKRVAIYRKMGLTEAEAKAASVQ